MVLGRAKSLKKQARRTLWNYIKAKLKLGKRRQSLRGQHCAGDGCVLWSFAAG
jgi:hypothetical protein